ncbi:FAD-binding and (Fe-S)-binding domain-containing protein [Falsarthrobacter nasiphocae]|uniref:D-lactate dehydrogenase (cytochrome) n=1 Tax=Falsarthrobacter nasiphocae TaxID=189863 RepID=A0AAE4C6Q4_9MICC|nr:FAD-binding and (Fe-S)-binding domain-containing protein [Falsarthrobacter nasiphocae]MDR6892402.1 D-lactate dehydrogenase [Falsarthrobacter nasiphocae]
MQKLLAKNPARIGRPAGARIEADRFPESLSGGTPEALRRGLEDILGPANVHSRPLDLVAYASDASPYRMCPAVVVSPESPEDMARLFEYCRENGRHLTFRSGGSSLNGQAQGDDILVDVRRHFRGMALEGETLRARPGEILAGVQRMLALHGRRFGPDPASASIATIGGILANNSGGMRCTVAVDSYHSIESATIVLPSGFILDTAAEDADERLAREEPEIAQGLIKLRDDIRADEALCARLRRKFTIRNTNALRLDAFLDADSPAQILRRLIVGSEGTLGFVAEARLATQPLPRVKAVAWVMLPDAGQAAGRVKAIMDAGADACELLVSPVLRESVGNFKGADPAWADLPDEAAALLVEVSGYDDDGLAERVAAVEDILKDAELTTPLAFTRDPLEMAQAWEIRGGLFPLIGRQRPAGTALITEDLCVPPAAIGEASLDLMALLRKHGHPDYVMGHAAFGNLHFFLTPSFETDEDIARYAAFIDEFVELILDRYDGSLKAEHGTGLSMAPFVEREWGSTAFGLMWRVKELLDPHGILAPNIKLTRDQDLHLKNFKTTPTIEAVATDCVECGFCESVCPSRNVTVTPRQRIAIRREMARQPEGSAMLASLHADYGHDAIDLCAADGTCSVACPVSIDTGALMKEFRAAESGKAGNAAALALAKNWGLVEAGARAGLTASDAVQRVLGSSLSAKVLGGVTDAVRRVVSEDLMPTAREGLPPANRRPLPVTSPDGATAVYFPACINRIFGRAGEGVSLPEAIVRLAEFAGRPVHIPSDVAGTCCGTPFSSKGYVPAKRWMAVKAAEDLWRWSDGGRLPVVVDASSCTHGFVGDVRDVLASGASEGDDDCRRLSEQLSTLEVLDAVTWARRELIPALEARGVAGAAAGRVAVHPTCSTMHLDAVDDLMAVASFAAEDAFIPVGAACCGTAGDRGLLHPELVESATRDERAGLAAAEAAGPVDAYVSANRTCEMGMTQQTGREYEHVLLLLHDALRPLVR